jgi:hypothetical protein
MKMWDPAPNPKNLAVDARILLFWGRGSISPIGKQSLTDGASIFSWF